MAATVQAAMVVPVNDELTTLQAAEVLGMPHSYLLHLMEETGMPFREVGASRIINRYQLLSHLQKVEAARNAALDRLVRLTENLDLYE